MAEFFLELFSEEIPARMQARGAEALARLIAEALAPLSPGMPQLFWGPRRIALAVEVRGEVAAREISERGPRRGAPEAALAGFLRKHGAAREELTEEGDYWVLRRTVAGQAAAALIAEVLPPLLWRFPWPKSMRWGGKSQFTWVRPLRRIVALLDGEVVMFDLRQGEDDGHGLASGGETEGHRFLAPGAFAVSGAADWREKLRERRVIADPAERRQKIEADIAALAAARGLRAVPDDGLLDEVTGLVEWPVALLGAIDARFMELPPEVRQVSMRVNQRYFALIAQDGRPAPYFAFIANIEAEDGGAAIIAGNERVLRARLADAEHFWNLDRRVRLESRVEKLKSVVFHAKLGTQYARAQRIARLAGLILPDLMSEDLLGVRKEYPELHKGYVERAGLLAKADLTTGMVGEFPELQGVMGYYYALHDGEHRDVALAIRDHYLPKSGADQVPPMNYATRAVALADRIDQLAGFFAIGERPTGSGDPYALRRAALGIIQIIRTFDGLGRFSLRGALNGAAETYGFAVPVDDIIAFVVERLRVQLRTEGKRHDVLAAVFAASADDNISRLLERATSISNLLASDDGANLLVAYRRATNILRIENEKDGPHTGEPDASLFKTDEEAALFRTSRQFQGPAGLIASYQSEYHLAQIARGLATLRAPVDAFFEKVTVNDPDPALRRNRLKLLSRIRDTMNRFADFSLIEG